MSGGKDKQILFQRIRSATAMDLTGKSAAFKSQRYTVLLLVLTKFIASQLIHFN